MHCGNESSLDQKFCRKCGFSLEPVSKLVLQDRGSEELDRAERQRLAAQRMFRWLSWGLLVMGLAVLMLVANKSFDFGKFFRLFASVVLLTGTGMALYGVIPKAGRGKSQPSNQRVNSSPIEIEKANTTRELAEKSPVPVPSVTERTTQLIEKAEPTVNAKEEV